jgi:hypothetical protein
VDHYTREKSSIFEIRQFTVIIMNPTYHCSECKESKPSTEEHWVPSSLKIGHTYPNRTSIGYCKSCCKILQAKYVAKIKERKLTRSRKPIDRNIRGKLYIIGPKENKNNQYPYKIGISSGTTITKRIAAIQTNHWIDLTVIYESAILDHIHKVESKLHREYKRKNVRGEWFKITPEDIQDIVAQVTKLP